MERGKADHIAECARCGRRREILALGCCASCYNVVRRKPGVCRHCKQKRPIYAKGECKPCRDAAYRGFR
jgi:hypothetical protein